MNIVHTEASCGWGGQEIRILEESRGMLARGHQVVVLCPPESRIFAEAKRRGIPVEALPIGRKNLKGLFALRRWLATHPADVINTHSSTDSWLAALACKTLHDAPPIVRTRHISAPIPANRASRWLYTHAVRHVATTGESLRQTLIRHNRFPANQITSVPTGIDTSRFAPAEDKAAMRHALGLDPARRYLGIVATLRSWKGHLFLLDAFVSLAKDHPNLTLLIVGEGPMRNVIENKIAELHLADRVQLAGQQDRPEDWLKALDVFCLPSYANEGVPQAVLQAMLTGLPIVSTPVGAITEAIADGKTGLIMPPKDSQALAAAISRLLDDAALANSLGAQAREDAINRFGFEHMLDKMETIFRAAVEPL
jgi:glycosyltransferase involved in cell wall biosynthesis